MNRKAIGLEPDVETVDRHHDPRQLAILQEGKGAATGISTAEVRLASPKEGSALKKKRKSPAVPWKKPKDMPKRPLSAYNLFFKAERENLLRSLDAATAAGDGDAATSDSKQSPTKTGKGDATDTSSGNKRNSQTPGIGFANLAKTIAAKWKNLSEAEKAPFEKKAAADKARYKEAVAAWRLKRKKLESSKSSGDSSGDNSPSSPTGLSESSSHSMETPPGKHEGPYPSDWFHTGAQPTYPYSHQRLCPPSGERPTYETLYNQPIRAYRDQPYSAVSRSEEMTKEKLPPEWRRAVSEKLVPIKDHAFPLSPFDGQPPPSSGGYEGLFEQGRYKPQHQSWGAQQQRQQGNDHLRHALFPASQSNQGEAFFHMNEPGELGGSGYTLPSSARMRSTSLPIRRPENITSHLGGNTTGASDGRPRSCLPIPAHLQNQTPLLQTIKTEFSSSADGDEAGQTPQSQQQQQQQQQQQPNQQQQQQDEDNSDSGVQHGTSLHALTENLDDDTIDYITRAHFSFS